MKFLSWIVAIIVILVSIVYVFVFTSFGNGFIKPIIESKIKENTKLDSKLTTFSLNMSEFEIFLELNRGNTISLKGNYSIFSQSLNAAYDVELKKLESLKPLTKTLLKGAFNLNGDAKGDAKELIITGSGDLASSDIKFKTYLKDFVPSKVKATIKELKLKEALVLLNQPYYTDGILSLNADISDLSSSNLKGKVVTTIKNGVLNSKYLTKTYEFKSSMPRTTFNSTTTTLLSGDVIDTKVDFNSNIANLDIKRARFNLNGGSLNSDYRVNILNLDRLYFITQQHMKGAIKANGVISKAKDLDLTFHTKIANGNIDAKVHNNDVHAELKSVGTLGILHMLIYPEIFESTLNGNLEYNLASSKGVFSAHVVDGNFAKNKIFTLIKQYSKFDMYRENFNGDINADINKDKILATLDLRSKRAFIKTKDAKIDTKKQTIDSDITLKANKNIITANLKGNINSPKVKVDLEKLIKSQAGEKVKEKAKEKLNNLLKKFF
jgi:hypothetical protein